MPLSSDSPRPSMAQWAAARLLEAIGRGEWQETLPGERVLAELIGVSRPVMREALQQLEAGGEIICEPNRARRISGSTSGRSSARRRVLLLFGSDHQVVSDDPFVYAMVTAFEQRGIAAEVRPHGAVYALHRSGFFSQPTVSILLSVPHSIQKWYAIHGFPAVISGSAYPGIGISSVDVDAKAVARHAVGQLFRLGHLRIACVSASRPRAGDLETEAGFLEGMAARPNAQPEILRPDVEPGELIRHLRRLFHQASPPTALLICHAPVAVAAASYAAQAGLRIPHDLSIICRDASPYLRFHYPRIACYSSNQAAAIRQLIRWTVAPPTRSFQKRLNVEFEPGGSLGSLAKVSERKAHSEVGK